jgi:hypothetical protein
VLGEARGAPMAGTLPRWARVWGWSKGILDLIGYLSFYPMLVLISSCELDILR